MLYRKIQEKLYSYYNNADARILVVDGARQVGKSYIIRETASKHFKNYIEINLKDDFDGDRFFENIRTTSSFYLQVSALYGDRLGNINNTIIFLDEIQVYPQLLTLLKPLKKEGRFRYIASGSILGLTLKHTFIPMGSIDEVKMYPLDFEEFLLAENIGHDVIEYLRDCFVRREQVEDGIHKVMISKFKEYLICGGLPAAVDEFVTNKNVYTTRQQQAQIYSFYKDDATQYDLQKKLKIKRIYESLTSYMDNKVKRIKYTAIENKQNANLARYSDEFDYLINSGCTIGIKAVSNPEYPLNDSSSKNLIKLYYNDVGILSELLFKNNIAAIMNKDYGTNLGSLYETAAATELIAHGHELYYFDSKKVGEVDFLINNYEMTDVMPIEIKSGNDQNNFRAIPKLVKEPYKLQCGYIFGNDNITKYENSLVTYPIYLIMFV